MKNRKVIIKVYNSGNDSKYAIIDTLEDGQLISRLATSKYKNEKMLNKKINDKVIEAVMRNGAPNSFEKFVEVEGGTMFNPKMEQVELHTEEV